MLQIRAASLFLAAFLYFAWQQQAIADLQSYGGTRAPANAGEKSTSTSESDVARYRLPDGTYATGVIPVHEKVPEAMRVVLGLIVGKSTLKDAQKKLGKQTISAAGEAGDFEAHLCYKGTDDTRVIFSLGELNSATNVISEFQLIGRKSSISFPSGCKINELVSSELKVSKSLRLGMTKDEVKKKIGQPRKELKGYFIYYFVSDELRASDMVTIDTSINIHFRNGVVDFIEIAHTESL